MRWLIMVFLCLVAGCYEVHPFEDDAPSDNCCDRRCWTGEACLGDFGEDERGEFCAARPRYVCPPGGWNREERIEAMSPEEARRVHINDALRDDEIERLVALCDAAEPGQWITVPGATPGELPTVARYGRKPLTSPTSFALMAEARTAIPRVVRGVRALEAALRNAWAAAASYRQEWIRDRDQHAENIVRASAAQTGPESDMDVLVEAVELGCFQGRGKLLRMTLEEWARGVSFQAPGRVFSIDIEGARRRREESDAIQKKIAADRARDIAEIQALLAELKLTKRQRAEVGAAAQKRIDEGKA